MFKVIYENTKTHKVTEIFFDTEEEAKHWAIGEEMSCDYSVCKVRKVEN